METSFCLSFGLDPLLWDLLTVSPSKFTPFHQGGYSFSCLLRKGTGSQKMQGSYNWVFQSSLPFSYVQLLFNLAVLRILIWQSLLTNSSQGILPFLSNSLLLLRSPVVLILKPFLATWSFWVESFRIFTLLLLWNFTVMCHGLSVLQMIFLLDVPCSLGVLRVWTIKRLIILA